jgi:hypothetical protein
LPYREKYVILSILEQQCCRGDSLPELEIAAQLFEEMEE